jgi:hypothetical protein
MNYLEIALANAANGYPTFPVRLDKRPLWGFNDWENLASTSPTVILKWWERHPAAIPAVTPGRIDKTVIDVDRKPGKPDGWESLIDRRVHVPPTTFRGASVSGLGLHLWFRDLSTSINGLLPGVDRKSRGGYVVTPYLLPPVSQIKVRVPLALQGGKVREGATGMPYAGGVVAWFGEHSGLTSSHAVQRVVRRFTGPSAETFAGHELLLEVQTHLVLLGVEGHGGVPEALDRLATIWADTPHTSAENPVAEWNNALAGAIEKSGGAKHGNH